MPMTPEQENLELRTFVRNALNYFDAAAEGQPEGDPAALYAEGQVCLVRLERPGKDDWVPLAKALHNITGRPHQAWFDFQAQAQLILRTIKQQQSQENIMPKPSIAELERILAGGNGPHNIEILPSGEIRAVPCRLSFGTGALYVQVGTYEGAPAVFVAKAAQPGEIGTNNPEEDGDPHSLKPGEYVLTFPTPEQAKAVADALCPAPQ